MLNDSAYTDVLDLRPSDGSPLIDAGTDTSVGDSNQVPNPLLAIDYGPAPRVEPTSLMPYERNDEGGPDIGA